MFFCHCLLIFAVFQTFATEWSTNYLTSGYFAFQQAEIHNLILFMASINFIFRPSSCGKHRKGSILLRLIHKGKVKVRTLPLKVYPPEWNSGNQHVFIPEDPDNPRHRYLTYVNEQLSELSTQLLQCIDNLDMSGSYSVEDILSCYYKDEVSGYLSGYSEKLARKLIQAGQERTAEAYRTVARGLIRFNSGKDIQMQQLNTCLFREFERHLKNQNKSLNTISYYMRNLRAIYNKAVQEQVLDRQKENPFAGVFTGFKKTRKRALTLDELQKLDQLNFTEVFKHKQPLTNLSENEQGLYTSWRLFFFAFHARGMSFVDLAYLRKENIRKGVIRYYRKKTGQPIEVKITPILDRLIESFAAETAYIPYVFPIIKDTEKSAGRQYRSGLRLQNIRLKKLASMAGIPDTLTTHVSRHSWATAAKEENLPVWVISEGLGHSSERMTYNYLASFNRSVLDQANDRIARALARGVHTSAP